MEKFLMKEVPLSELSVSDAELVEKARLACDKAYAPYSRFCVGAAVLLANGECVTGANQENASYPVGICAERSTLATVHNIYPGVRVVALALAAKGEDGQFVADIVTPCGMCRQAIAEWESRFGKPIRIIMTSKDGALVAESVENILPYSFS